MKSKNIKVAYTSRSTTKGYDQVPKLRIEGKWLEALGFHIGDYVHVEYEEGSIRIRPFTAEEMNAQKQQNLQAELNRKIIQLSALKSSLESEATQLSMVAEATTPYAKAEVLG